MLAVRSLHIMTSDTTCSQRALLPKGIRYLGTEFRLRKDEAFFRLSPTTDHTILGLTLGLPFSDPKNTPGKAVLRRARISGQSKTTPKSWR
jgi:hypothetical protein